MFYDDFLKMTAVKSDESYHHEMLVGHACYVARHGFPLNYFKDEKDAMSFILHTYGRSDWQARGIGVSIKKLDENVMPGGKVIYDGLGQFSAMTCCSDSEGKDKYANAGIGVICGSFRLNEESERESVSICFNSNGPYYDEDGVNSSGGPLPQYQKLSQFKVIGLTFMNFWRFSESVPRANSGGHFTLQVPVYRWTGNNE